MKAMVLAAGRGERMRPITDTLPKPLVAGGGQAVDRLSPRSARAGWCARCRHQSLVAAADRFVPRCGDGADYGVRMTYTDEGPVALETGGGIFNAIQHLGPGPFLVVNLVIRSLILTSARRARAPLRILARVRRRASCS